MLLWVGGGLQGCSGLEALHPASRSRFAKPPTATLSEAGQVAITFTLAEPTDYAVFIKNADGHTVRHLAAQAGGAGADGGEPELGRLRRRSVLATSVAASGRPANSTAASVAPSSRAAARARTAWAVGAPDAESPSHRGRYRRRRYATALGSPGEPVPPRQAPRAHSRRCGRQVCCGRCASERTTWSKRHGPGA